MENEALIKTSTLIAIADAIRAANDGTQKMLPEEMEAFIRANSATTADIVDAVRSTAGDSAITAEQAAAYIVSNFVKPSVRQTAKTWTPGTSDQSIAAGTYLTGAQTIKGDANLTSANIKQGVSIFGKAGSLVSAAAIAANFIGCTKITSGSITLASTGSANAAITHNLGVVPKLFIICCGEASSYTAYSNKFTAFAIYIQISENTYIKIVNQRATKLTGGNNTFSWFYYDVSHAGAYGLDASTTDKPSITVTTTTASTHKLGMYDTPFYWIAMG